MKDTYSFIENFERFSKLTELVKRDGLSFAYKFMDTAEFSALYPNKTGTANRVYVEEILFRAHWASLAAVLRNRRWMHGMDAALKYPNFFTFCACLRGMLESAADSYDSLRLVLATIAEHFASFRLALSGKVESGAICCTELEDTLIHFTHGRKVEKMEDVPASHRAKTMQQYIATLEASGSNRFRDLYRELCEITHPAAYTVHFFAAAEAVDEGEFKFVDPNDMPFILEIISRYDDTFGALFQKTFNSAFLTLHVLNRFDDDRIKTRGVDGIDFSKVPSFFEVKKKMIASQSSSGFLAMKS